MLKVSYELLKTINQLQNFLVLCNVGRLSVILIGRVLALLLNSMDNYDIKNNVS